MTRPRPGLRYAPAVPLGACTVRFAREPARVVLAALALALMLLFPLVCRAGIPVIAPGREAEILALFQPHELGDSLSDGWTLHSFSVDAGTIHVWIEGPPASEANGQDAEPVYAELRLDHPDYGPLGSRALPGFAVSATQVPPGSQAAIDALERAVAANDAGEFWARDMVYAEGEGEVLRGSSRRRLVQLLTDGVVLISLLTLSLLALVARKLAGAPRWVVAALCGAVLGGALLRVWLSPAVALAPWPYSRFLVSARLLYEGPVLAMAHEGALWMTETVLTSTLVLACLAPLAVYVHARYLLDDHRAALVVAVVVGVLPLHLRFSHSDAAFIPSITVSSLVFTLVHAATRERSAAWAWIALAIVGFPLALMFQVRPLNIMYYPLLVATAFVDGGLEGEKPPVDRLRAALAFVLITGITFGLGVPWLLADFGQQVSEGLSLETLRGAVEVIFSPRMNALLNPSFTPPGFTALAVLGAVDLWRRGRARLFLFLVLWLLGFLVAHAYVIPRSPYMQARYHLHLVVPYMLLVACGFEAALRWLKARRESGEAVAGRVVITAKLERGLVVGLVAYALASPLIHLGFIRAVDFNDTQEFLFVHEQRERIPEACTVIEYIGDTEDVRFERVGAYMDAGVRSQRWTVLTIPMAADGDDGFEGADAAAALPEAVRAAIESPPDCLYWYAGLPCWGTKPEGSHRAPACEFMDGVLPMEEVAALERASRVYDGNLAEDLEDGTPIRFSLSRVRTEDLGAR